MKKEIIISGFGGQGVLSMGKILAYSGLMEDKEVTWMPAYGPEQRGGTANVTVIVSDERISSPILSKYDIAVVLNQPSLEKFEPKIKPGGILIYDGFGIINKPTRKLRDQRHGQGCRDEERQGVQHDCARWSAQGGSRGERQGCGEGSFQDPSRAPSLADPPQYGGPQGRCQDY